MRQFILNEIGTIRVENGCYQIHLTESIIPALEGLDGFSHLHVLWWFDQFDQPEMRALTQTEKPYKKGPDVLGLFATRSPIRPNLLALSTVQVLEIDYDQGIITVDWIDGHDQTPVLDIKPFTPSDDVLKHYTVPEWCAHWPKRREESGEFNWEAEFNF